jgi:hypothetical protein
MMVTVNLSTLWLQRNHREPLVSSFLASSNPLSRKSLYEPYTQIEQHEPHSLYNGSLIWNIFLWIQQILHDRSDRRYPVARNNIFFTLSIIFYFLRQYQFTSTAVPIYVVYISEVVVPTMIFIKGCCQKVRWTSKEPLPNIGVTIDTGMLRLS